MTSEMSMSQPCPQEGCSVYGLSHYIGSKLPNTVVNLIFCHVPQRMESSFLTSLALRGFSSGTGGGGGRRR